MSKMRTRAGGRVVAAFLATLAALFLPTHATAEGPPQQIIVQYEDGATPTDAGAAATEARQLPPGLERAAAAHGAMLRFKRRMATGADVLRLEGRLPAQALEALARSLAREPGVRYAEVDRLLKPLLTPNDTRYNEQWHYFEATGGLRANTAWDTSTGSGVVVAVLDTGYRPHADLVANIVGGYDMIADTFVSNDGNGRDSDAQDPGDWSTAGQCDTLDPGSDSSWHGTHVAGTIAAVTNNGSGVAGVAFGAKVLPVRVLGRCGGYTSDIADGIIWASGGTVSGVPANPNPAKVINMSLGGSGACDTTSQNAINSARSRGTVVIVAAGNSNVNASNASPANCSGVVTVASTDRNGAKSYFSNFGAVVDVAAPGGDVRASASNGILSTLNTGTTTPGADSYEFYQGTSMATPHVAGVAALMISRTPSLTPDQVESQLKSTARAFPGTCSQCGTGIVDANAALNGGGGGGGPTALTNGVPVTGLSGATGSQTFFTLVVPAGATGLKFEMSGGSGDADLYVKFGSAPTTSVYDCRPYLNGNTETCNIATAQAGTYHVMLHGYAAYSGVTLKGSYTTGGGGGACAVGFTEYTGTFSGSGQSQYKPTSSGYVSSVSGVHSGRLTGPGGSDFDLFLQRRSGSAWSTVNRSEGPTSTESIDHSGSSGTYRWRVYSYSGSGSYTLCIKKP